jgi:pimeloyl-ACP methyl ester carboxylesterase
MVQLDRATIATDAAPLAALVYSPAVRRFRSPALLSHGLTASKESLDLLAGYLCGRGYACVTFDFRGHKLGASAGDMNSIGDALADLAHAAAWARERWNEPQCVLIGHSMGALVSLASPARGVPTEAVVAVATGVAPSRGFRGPVGQALMRQRGDYVSGVGPQALLKEMDALADTLIVPQETPALLVAARNDVLMKPARVAELARRIGPTVELAEVDAGHLDAPDAARGLIAAWLERKCVRLP